MTRVGEKDVLMLFGYVLGNWGSASVQREGVWSNNGQEETLWMAGSDFSQICSHGQRLLSVSNYS